LEPFNRDNLWGLLQNKAKGKLVAEQVRCGIADMTEEPFLKIAYQAKGVQ
jgi:hypothetical protein